MSESPIWISRAGQQFGPYAMDEAKAYLRSGQIASTDFASTSGPDGQWLPVAEVLGVAPPPPTPNPVKTGFQEWWANGIPWLRQHPIVSASIVIAVALLFKAPVFASVYFIIEAIHALLDKQWLRMLLLIALAIVFALLHLIFIFR